MTLDAVVFDFDGLIMDSEWVIFESARAAFESHGHSLSVEAWSTVVGINDDHEPRWWELLCDGGRHHRLRARRLRSGLRLDEPREALKAAMLELPALPGVEVLVDSLTAQGVPLGVASSSSRGWLERNLERLGLVHRFATLVGADVVGGVGKPAPDVYLRACADLGAEPARSVALEDSVHGVAAAKAAGMRAVAVPSHITSTHDMAQADLVVESLEHLHVATLEEHPRRRSDCLARPPPDG